MWRSGGGIGSEKLGDKMDSANSHPTLAGSWQLARLCLACGPGAAEMGPLPAL